MIDIRQVPHPDAVRRFDTAELRRHFLIEQLFVRNEVRLTYSHIDRLVVGGACPASTTLALPAPKAVGTDSFLQRRELGVLNVGGAGTVTVGDQRFELAHRECLYVGMGAGEVLFESKTSEAPAKFYLVSTPAHRTCPTVKLTENDANTIELGTPETANVRTIRQYIIPGVCESCQLVLGFTELKSGSIWNTMPTHTHDRRSEVYLYFDLATDARVVHLMGEPQETRHLLIANEEVVLSPGWSIHSGVGTRNYSFVWAMGGDNQDYTDMDPVAMEDMR